MGRFGRMDGVVNNASISADAAGRQPRRNGSVARLQWRAPFFLARRGTAPEGSKGAIVTWSTAMPSARCAIPPSMHGQARWGWRPSRWHRTGHGRARDAIGPANPVVENETSETAAARLARTPLARTGTPAEVAKPCNGVANSTTPPTGLNLDAEAARWLSRDPGRNQLRGCGTPLPASRRGTRGRFVRHHSDTAR